MSTLTSPVRIKRTYSAILENGDRMKQQSFTGAYTLYRGDEKFELIRGIVYMSSPVRQLMEAMLLGSSLLDMYCIATPGVEAGADATAILGEDSERNPI